MNKTYSYLTYAGTLPFILCTLLLSLDILELPLLGSVDNIMSVYGLVISTFLAGAHWGQHLRIDKTPWQRALAISSNFIAILLWLSFLSLEPKIFMLILVPLFTALLLIDSRLYQSTLISQHYFSTRLIATAIVIISLLISVFLQ